MLLVIKLLLFHLVNFLFNLNYQFWKVKWDCWTVPYLEITLFHEGITVLHWQKNQPLWDRAWSGDSGGICLKDLNSFVPSSLYPSSVICNSDSLSSPLPCFRLLHLSRAPKREIGQCPLISATTRRPWTHPDLISRPYSSPCSALRLQYLLLMVRNMIPFWTVPE